VAPVADRAPLGTPSAMPAYTFSDSIVAPIGT
jgi:hypothetical protein